MKHAMMSTSALVALMAARPLAAIGNPRNEAAPNAGEIAALLKTVEQKLESVSSDVRKTAEEAMSQTKAQGDTTKELKASADSLLMAHKTLGDAQAKLTNRLEQLETRNTDLEQQLISRRGGQGEEAKSFGHMAANHDNMRAFAKAGSKGVMRLSMPVRQAITSTKPGGGGLIWSDRETEIVGMPKRQMTIRQLLTQGRTSSNSIEYAKQTVRTNNARPVTEGAQKPESTYSWAQADAIVRTIAHWVHVSRQAMEDADQLETELDGELRYGLMLKEEGQLLKGDGTGQNLPGLVTEATAFSAAFSISGATMIDTLRLALLQATLAEYPSDGIVLNPTDWARIELTKDGENRYLFASIIQMAGPQLWGRPVVETQSMDEDEFLVGAFKMAATIYDRMDAEVIASSEDRDNFITNMITVRAEERLALAIKRSASLITGDFGNVT